MFQLILQTITVPFDLESRVQLKVQPAQRVSSHGQGPSLHLASDTTAHQHCAHHMDTSTASLWALLDRFFSLHYHRIIEWFELEGTFKGHLVQPPCHEQGHLPLDQVAQSPVQPDLECSQGWGIHHLSGKPLPVSHHSCRKKFLPSF